MMKPRTFHQLTVDVMQFCADKPRTRQAVFARVEHIEPGVFRWLCLWLAVEEINGNKLATAALDALLQM